MSSPSINVNRNTAMETGKEPVAEQAEQAVFSGACIRRQGKIALPEQVEVVVLYLLDRLERPIPGLQRKFADYYKGQRAGDGANLADVLAVILTEREVRLSKQRMEAIAIVNRVASRRREERLGRD